MKSALDFGYDTEFLDYRMPSHELCFFCKRKNTRFFYRDDVCDDSKSKLRSNGMVILRIRIDKWIKIRKIPGTTFVQ